MSRWIAVALMLLLGAMNCAPMWAEGGFTVWLPVVGKGPDVNTASFYTYREIVDANRIVERTSLGEWQAMDTGFDAGYVSAIVKGLDGTIYAAGSSLSTPADPGEHIYRWRGTSWEPLPGGGLNATAFALLVLPNGNILAGGDFTASTGGVPVNLYFIGLYNVATDTWEAYGNGFNAYIRGMALDNAGNVYATGGFNDVHGVLIPAGGTYNRIVQIAPDKSYSPLGTGLNGIGYRVALGADWYPYVVGNFTQANGVTVNYVARWNGTTFEALNGGVGNIAYRQCVMPDGTLFVSANTTTFGGITANYIGRWNGVDWAPLGSGLNLFAYDITPYRGNSIIVGGVFTTAGGITLPDKVAMWNGSNWTTLDIDLPGVVTIYTVFVDGERIILGYDTAGTAVTGGTGTVTVVNAGSAKVYPKFTITRTGGTGARLESIRNLTTGEIIWFNWEIMDGETIVIDLSPRHKTVMSSIMGNQLSKVLQPSNFTAFGLTPGVNVVALYIVSTGAPTLTAYMEWPTEYLSIDGAAE